MKYRILGFLFLFVETLSAQPGFDDGDLKDTPTNGILVFIIVCILFIMKKLKKIKYTQH